MNNYGFTLSTEQLHQVGDIFGESLALGNISRAKLMTDIMYSELFDTYTVALKLGFRDQARKTAQTLEGLGTVAQNLAWDDNENREAA